MPCPAGLDGLPVMGLRGVMTGAYAPGAATSRGLLFLMPENFGPAVGYRWFRRSSQAGQRLALSFFAESAEE